MTSYYSALCEITRLRSQLTSLPHRVVITALRLVVEGTAGLLAADLPSLVKASAVLNPLDRGPARRIHDRDASLLGSHAVAHYGVSCWLPLGRLQFVIPAECRTQQKTLFV